MFDQSFFTGKTGTAALISIAMMVTFNLFALSQQADAVPAMLVITAPMVELA